MVVMVMVPVVAVLATSFGIDILSFVATAAMADHFILFGDAYFCLIVLLKKDLLLIVSILMIHLVPSSSSFIIVFTLSALTAAITVFEAKVI